MSLPTLPFVPDRGLMRGLLAGAIGGGLLFVLGLFLLSPRIGPLVGYATVFTLAHALTLALGALEVFTLQPRVVEPLITFSIAWIAIENLATRRRHAGWRAGIVFGFGLLHGLGFAHVLGELGLPPGQRTLALIAFNAGVELGQLAVIATALLTLGWFRRKPWYRQRVVLPLSFALTAGGLAWTVDRVVA